MMPSYNHNNKRENPQPSPTRPVHWNRVEVENLVEQVCQFNGPGGLGKFLQRLSDAMPRGLHEIIMPPRDSLGVAVPVTKAKSNICERFIWGVAGIYNGRGYHPVNMAARQDRDAHGTQLTKGEKYLLEFAIGHRANWRFPAHHEEYWFDVGFDYATALLGRRRQDLIVLWAHQHGCTVRGQTTKPRGPDWPYTYNLSPRK